MKILVACEESQTVCKAFRAKGHEAYSCDILEPSGGHPEWHILGDALEALDGGQVTTVDGTVHDVGQWDMLIAHPPCTYLSNVATRSFSLKSTAPEKVVERWQERACAAVFFMHFALSNIEKVCIENPVGFMSRAYRKPDQIIDPYMFATSENDAENYVTKRTCLWLKGLHPLKGTGLPRPDNAKLFGTTSKGKVRTWEDTYSRDAMVRSKTFPGIAKAMAEQWG
nr:MAG TPA: DNA (cytosine-5)-methyltransferase 3A [Caudoviricetes sp.]